MSNGEVNAVAGRCGENGRNSASVPRRQDSCACNTDNRGVASELYLTWPSFSARRGPCIIAGLPSEIRVRAAASAAQDYWFRLCRDPRFTKKYKMSGRGVPNALRPYICPSCARSIKLQSRRYATAAPPDIYDVVCVGGGPAGLSLLTALRTSNGITLSRAPS